MNLLESHGSPLVSAYLHVSSLLEDLPQSFSSLVLSKSVCLPLSVASVAFSVRLTAQKRLGQGETDHLCFLWKVWPDPDHSWWHSQGSRGPPWSFRPFCLSRILHPVQKTSSFHCAICSCVEPSSCSSGTPCESLSLSSRSWSFGIGVVSDLFISCKFILLSLWCLKSSWRSPSTCQ